MSLGIMQGLLVSNMKDLNQCYQDLVLWPQKRCNHRLGLVTQSALASRPPDLAIFLHSCWQTETLHWLAFELVRPCMCLVLLIHPLSFGLKEALGDDLSTVLALQAGLKWGPVIIIQLFLGSQWNLVTWLVNWTFPWNFDTVNWPELIHLDCAWWYMISTPVIARRDAKYRLGHWECLTLEYGLGNHIVVLVCWQE